MKRITSPAFFLSIVLQAILAAGCSRSAGARLEVESPDLRPGTHQGVIEVAGLERTYLLFVPDCYDDETELPLVFMFHGGGGSAPGVSRDTGWSDQSQKSCFLVAYPEGLPEDRNRRASFSANPRLWNDGSGRFNRDLNDIEFIHALLDYLKSELRIDDDRIYAAGFSNGASMAFQVGIALSQEIAAIAPVAGALWVHDFSLEDPVSMIYITGTDDPLNPLEGGPPGLERGDSQPGGGKSKPPVQNHINSWIKALDCDPTPSELPAPDLVNAVLFSDCRGGTEVQYYTIEGGGHHWPGGKVRLPEIYVGEKIDVFDGVDLVWDFFQAHPKP